MDVYHENIDKLRKKTGCSYEEAIEALEKANGDLLKALIYLEKHEKTIKEQISATGDDILKVIKGLIKQGNITRIKVKKDGNILVNIPVNAGAIGIVLLPYATILASIAAIVTDCIIEIEKKEETIFNVNNEIKKAGTKIEEMVKEVKNNNDK